MSRNATCGHNACGPFANCKAALLEIVDVWIDYFKQALPPPSRHWPLCGLRYPCTTHHYYNSADATKAQLPTGALRVSVCVCVCARMCAARTPVSHAQRDTARHAQPRTHIEHTASGPAVEEQAPCSQAGRQAGGRGARVCVRACEWGWHASLGGLRAAAPQNPVRRCAFHALQAGAPTAARVDPCDGPGTAAQGRRLAQGTLGRGAGEGRQQAHLQRAQVRRGWPKGDPVIEQNLTLLFLSTFVQN